MKLYIVNWGFYSCDSGSSEIAAIYSTYELALVHIREETRRGLKQSKHRKTGDYMNIWTDGDYWISIDIGYMDSPALYISPKECEPFEDKK